jgi:hypothetical protein
VYGNRGNQTEDEDYKDFLLLGKVNLLCCYQLTKKATYDVVVGYLKKLRCVHIEGLKKTTEPNSGYPLS